MVAGQDHDRHFGAFEQCCGARQKVERQAVVLERVAGQEQQVGCLVPRGRDDRGKRRRAVPGERIDVNVRAVDDDEILHAGARIECAAARRSKIVRPSTTPLRAKRRTVLILSEARSAKSKDAGSRPALARDDDAPMKLR